MGASKKFGLETTTRLSARLQIAVIAVMVLVLGCSSTSDSSSPMAPSAIRADALTAALLPEHALVVTLFPSGGKAVVSGEAAEEISISICGFQFNIGQHIGFLPPSVSSVSADTRYGFIQPTVLSASTALIPPGAHPYTIVAYCSPFWIIDVDFSQ